MLHIITGPPASGKTSFIAEHAKPGDIRIDLDHIANQLADLDQRIDEYTKCADIAYIQQGLIAKQTQEYINDRLDGAD